MKVQRAIEVPGCSEITIKVTQDMKFTDKVYQNHLESKIWTLSHHFRPKFGFLVIFGPEMKVQRT